MYISELSICGYRCSGKKSTIHLNKGLNVLIGENGCGKTTVIDAIRLLLKDPNAIYACNQNDFYMHNNESSAIANIDACFSGLNDDEKVIFLTWLNGGGSRASVRLEITKSTKRQNMLRRSYWGGAARSGILDQDTFERVECVYLPALRDAERGLSGRYSILSSLIKKKYGNDANKLVELANNLNRDMLNDEESENIKSLNYDINLSIDRSMGREFGQRIQLQFTEATFNRIAENIKMVFSSGSDDYETFRDLSLNSLGYNNFLYIATIMSELEIAGKSDIFTVLLIEEPEAHLHPQLQVRFMKYLEQLEDNLDNVQIIVTTHSATLASSVGISKLIHLSRRRNDGSITSTTMSEKNFGDLITESYINRWLDATKSTMLFSRGVILVEGIAESIVIPRLAELVLAKYNEGHKDNDATALEDSLDKMGVSVININGINFKYFDKLFANFDSATGPCIPMRCSNITDRDPGSNEYPTCGKNVAGSNPMIELEKIMDKKKNVRTFISPLKTFEYDLAFYNPAILAESLLLIWPHKKGNNRKMLQDIKNSRCSVKNQAEVIYKCIERNGISKGSLANVLAGKIDKDFIVPNYIEQAVLWACGVDDVKQKETNS